MGKQERLSNEMLRELSSELRVVDRRLGEKRGAFGIEARAVERAREIERAMIEAEIRGHDRGYEGNTRRCPRCGKETQRYKGDAERSVEFECGEIRFVRSYYVCCECGASSYPLDEELGLVSGRVQGQLREKLSMLAVMAPYHQAPQVCKTMFGTERHAASMRRSLLKEAERYEQKEDTLRTKSVETAGETVYIQIDGHMCPTREARKTPEDQGFREAKAVLAYRSADVAQVTTKRKEILSKILKAKITTAEEFRTIVDKVYDQANADQAQTVVILGDGAKWIWNIAEDVAPEAIQILDFAHAKQYLYEYANIRFTSESARVVPWVKEQESRLCNDQVQDVISEMKLYADLDQRLQKIYSYYENNAQRMLYGTYRAKGLTIGSGAIESAGKQLSASRVKGAGMRWNVVDVNPLIAMRAAFLDGTWSAYWRSEELLAA